MPADDKISLAKALKNSDLDRFISEREGMIGDEAAFNRAVQAMAQTSKEARPASPKGGSDD